MMTFEDFTPEQRTVIAEFVYSFDSDILIKSDAFNLIKLILNKKMIDRETYDDLKAKIENSSGSVCGEIIDILFTAVDEKEGKKIMNEYFGN